MDLPAEPPISSPSPIPAKMDLSPDWSPSPDSSTTSLFIRPLFAYLSCNFYGTAICINPIYSQNVHCKGFFSRKFPIRRFFIVFGFVLQKWVNSNNITTSAHYELNVAVVEHFKPLCAWNDLVILFCRASQEVSRKKKHIEVREVYISPHCRLALVPPNFMKFGVSGQLVCQIFNQSVKGLQSFDTSKIALSHWVAASPDSP